MALQASVYEHQQRAVLSDLFTSVKDVMEESPLRKVLRALEDLRAAGPRRK
jgi:hypothetical protein